MFVGHIEEILAYAWFDWKEWSEWSPCSNMGLKTRTRECPGVHCLDDGQGNGMLSNGTEIADCTVSTYYIPNLYHNDFTGFLQLLWNFYNYGISRKI